MLLATDNFEQKKHYWENVGVENPTSLRVHNVLQQLGKTLVGIIEVLSESVVPRGRL